MKHSVISKNTCRREKTSILIVLSFLCLSPDFISISSASGNISNATVNTAPYPVEKTHMRPTHVTTTLSGQVDMCLSCHRERPDKAHGREVTGCYACHQGNPLAGTMEKAHAGMLKNPGELRFADKTCGATGCHPDEVSRAKKSLMATNRGIISTLRYYWHETDDHNEDITVEKLEKRNLESPAIDYFRKLCGTCHTGMKKGKLPGFLAQKGGGCTACHSTKPLEKYAGKGVAHIRMIQAVPSENCIRCHNRSGRIGLTYTGRYESEGYGTPYYEGDLSRKQMEDGRYYEELPEDIHHAAGMVCVDCHTQKEVMGDGNEYAHIDQQLEMKCTTCHTDHDTLEKAVKIAEIPYSTWKHDMNKYKTPRMNIAEADHKLFIKGLTDDKLHPLHKPLMEQCLQPVHRRLSCQACHSTWVPQCYGCHVRYTRAEKQLDKISHMNTWGKWTEFKSMLRFEAPPLGILETEKDVSKAEKDTGAVVILVPG